MESMTEIMNKGMKCLTEQMNIIAAEQFISIIIREKFDYTKWQRGYFDAKSPETISKEEQNAIELEKDIIRTMVAIREGKSVIDGIYYM